MKQIINVVLICAVALAACTTPFKKTKDGSEYKVISVKKGARVITGNFMEMSVLAKYKDSVLFSTIDEGMPQFGMYDTANFPAPYKEAFKTIHVGDSVVLRIPTDSLIAKGQAAPFMKKGEYIYQSYTITNLYATKEQVDSVQKIYMPAAKAKAQKKQMDQIQKDLAEKKPQIDKDSKLIEEYLTKNNIKYTKTTWGTYIAVQTEGTGEKLTSTTVASVNYTGRTFDSSKVFDSNTDPAFNHVQPYDINLGQMGAVILGWTDALLQMKKGTKATVYIPSPLAYGKDGRQPEIKGDAILVFDMQVVDANDEADLMAKQAAMQQQQQAAQQKMMDSLQKAAPKK
ncbi:MAG: FKBP-type peptidyl-prolyl cis-trans isomerase [Ferruginibacter sp.]